MCHTEVPPGQTTPEATRSEILVPLPTGEHMPATQFGDQSASPVVIVADVFGPSPFYEHLAALLAEAGFRAVLPDYFFRQGRLSGLDKQAAFARRAQLDETGTLRDLEATVALLRDGTGQPVGTVGFCMGGTLVLDLAATVDGLATVAYYGFPSAPASDTSPPRPLDLVDDVRGPVLAFWGDQDETVGLDTVRRYVAAAPASVQHHILPGLGHGFLAAADLTDADDAAAATWRQSLAFLKQHAVALA
jgi:carboxymethylenebutenolidase